MKAEANYNSIFGFFIAFITGRIDQKEERNRNILIQKVYGTNWKLDINGDIVPSTTDGLYNLHVSLIKKGKILNKNNPITEYLMFDAPFARRQYPVNRDQDLGTYNDHPEFLGKTRMQIYNETETESLERADERGFRSAQTAYPDRTMDYGGKKSTKRRHTKRRRPTKRRR